jgi:hypothetical protein
VKKNIVSLSIAFIVLVISVTGILLYIKQKAHIIEMSHAIFGLLFVLLGAFHIYNNWKSLKSYSVEKQSISKEIIYVFLTFAVILTLSLTNVLEPIAEFGVIFAKGKKPSQGISFAERRTNQDKIGKSVSFIIQKNEKSMDAALAIDIVDSTNSTLEKLYGSDSVQVGPPSNLILNTKIQAAAPFTIRVVAKEKENQSVYTGVVKSLESGIYQPINTSNTLLKRVILEVQ